MQISDLDDDLLIYVLVRLPPERLGQLKIVSKSWNALISSQKFIKSHLNHSRIVQKSNVLVTGKTEIQMVEFSITGDVDGIFDEDLDENFDEDFDCSRDLYKDFNCKLKRLHCLPELLDERIIDRIVGSSNGLLCLLLSRNHNSCETCRLSDEHKKSCFLDGYVFALCNPLTKSTWDLPGNQWKRLFSNKSLYGFWYDDVNDDYKVVIMNHIFEKEGIHEYECEVYSLRSNSWSRIYSYLDFSIKYEYAGNGVLVNYALHWMILDDGSISNFILAFDLKTYKLKIFPVPQVLEGIDHLKLTVLNGSLVLSNDSIRRDSYDVWEMKDYGLNDSWMRITINKSYAEYYSFIRPLALLEDNHKRILISYIYSYPRPKLQLADLVSHQAWIIKVPCNFQGPKQLQFVGSLVQPYPPSLKYEKIFCEDALKSFESFHIQVNGVFIDSQLPEHVRRKYYDLCCSKKSFLHERLVPGVPSKLAASMVIEAVKIVDSIRRCKFITTSRNEIEKWGESLRSFELLGMNVGFLRDRIRWLLSVAFDSEEAIEAKKILGG